MSRCVWLAQCLCSDRHAIFGTAGEAENRRDAEARVLGALQSSVAEMLRDGLVNPWCSLCGAAAESWTFEVAHTRWLTMAEAVPEIRRIERQNMALGALFGDLHRTTKH